MVNVVKIICIRVIWDHKEILLPNSDRSFAIHILPEPEFPLGRKGLVLSAAWGQLSDQSTAGMLIIDGDVAFDPLDKAAVAASIERFPDQIHTAPIKLWPISTHLDHWIWGHGRGIHTQEDVDDPDSFTFSFTYLPRQLIENCINAGMTGWAYPKVDKYVVQQARQMGIPINVVRDANPKHLNY